MRIGTGLPNPIPGTPGPLLLEWARRAEALGFSTLATIDRIVYPSYESLIALAAAAAVTERIGLLTNILIGPTRNPVLLAKEAASVDQISGGRFTLGVGVGGREDDFEAAGQEWRNRGQRWDEALETMHRAWKGEPVAGSGQPVTPTPVREGRVPLLIGGQAEAAMERMVRWGTGWTAGGAPPEQVAPMVERVRQAWQEAAREGSPRIVALSYYALGDGALERLSLYIKDYYAFIGPMATQMAQFIPRTPDMVRETRRRFEDAGVDELIFDPTIAEIEQLERLAEVVL